MLPDKYKVNALMDGLMKFTIMAKDASLYVKDSPRVSSMMNVMYKVGQSGATEGAFAICVTGRLVFYSIALLLLCPLRETIPFVGELVKTLQTVLSDTLASMGGGTGVVVTHSERVYETRAQRMNKAIRKIEESKKHMVVEKHEQMLTGATLVQKLITSSETDQTKLSAANASLSALESYLEKNGNEENKVIPGSPSMLAATGGTVVSMITNNCNTDSLISTAGKIKTKLSNLVTYSDPLLEQIELYTPLPEETPPAVAEK